MSWLDKEALTDIAEAKPVYQEDLDKAQFVNMTFEEEEFERVELLMNQRPLLDFPVATLLNEATDGSSDSITDLSS